MKPSSYLLIVIIIVAAIFGEVSLSYSSLKMKLLPALVSGLILILAIAQLTLDILAHRRAASGNQPAEVETSAKVNEEVGLENVGDIRGDMIGFGWLMAMIVGTYFVGFLVTIPIFIFIYLITHDIGWLKSVIVAAVTVILVYLIFVKLLQSELFPGIILEHFM